MNEAPKLKPSICVFLDILGFSEIIEEAYSNGNEASLLTEISEALHISAEDLESFEKKSSDGIWSFTVKFFTDNVVIGYDCTDGEGPFLKNAKRNNLALLFEFLADYQFTMACKGFFIRGGISIGSLAIGDKIVFGKALIDAHKLEKSVARNPRIILDKKLEELFPLASENDKEAVLYGLMRDVDGYFFVDYFSALNIWVRSVPQHGLGFLSNEGKLMVHREQVERHLKKTETKPEIWSKYFWVANYHNNFCDRLDLDRCKIDESLLRPQPVKLLFKK